MAMIILKLKNGKRPTLQGVIVAEDASANGLFYLDNGGFLRARLKQLRPLLWPLVRISPSSSEPWSSCHFCWNRRATGR